MAFISLHRGNPHSPPLRSSLSLQRTALGPLGGKSNPVFLPGSELRTGPPRRLGSAHTLTSRLIYHLYIGRVVGPIPPFHTP